MRLEGFVDISASLGVGVYALVAKGRVIYVGKSKKMISRINSHRSVWAAKRAKRPVPDWLPIPGLLFDEIHIRTCRVEDLDRLEAEMIDKYKPRYNVQLKTAQKVQAPISITVSGVPIAMNTRSEGFVRRL